MHPGRGGEGHRGHHAPRSRHVDGATGMQDVREQPTGTAQRARQGIGNRAQDEPPCGQFGQIGDH